MVKICTKDNCENTANGRRTLCDTHTRKKTKECANDGCTNVPTAKRLICDICEPLGTCKCGNILPNRQKTTCDECRNGNTRLCSCGEVTGYRSDKCVDCKANYDDIHEICEEVLCNEQRIGKCRLCVKHQGVFSKHRQTYREYNMKWNGITIDYRFNDCICVVCKNEDKLQCIKIYCSNNTTRNLSVCGTCTILPRVMDFKKRRDLLENAGIFGTSCSKCKKKKLFKYFDHSSDKCIDCNTECTVEEIDKHYLVYTTNSSDTESSSVSTMICNENYCDNKVTNGSNCIVCNRCRDIPEKHRGVVRKYFGDWKDVPKNKDCTCKKCTKMKQSKMCKNIFCTNLKEPHKALCVECKNLTLTDNKTKEREAIKAFGISGVTCVECKEKVEFHLLVNDRNRCVSCKNTGERDKAKQANEKNKMSTGKRQCNKCGQSKYLNEFDGNRNTCNTCRNKAEIENFKEKRKDMTEFTCSKCDKVLPIDMCESDRFECKSCSSDRRGKFLEKRKMDPDYRESIDTTIDRCCSDCKLTKELSEFYFRPDTYLYSYLCKLCKVIRMGKSYKEMMCKRYVENPEEARRKNADKMKEYREKNPEKWKEMMDRWKSNPLNVMNAKRNKIASDCLYTDEMSDDRALELITRECYYCDGFSDNANNFNGYDRVNNEIHYTDDNVVACCSTCNYIKRCLSQDIFLKHIKNIVYYFDDEKDKIEYIDFGYGSAIFSDYKRRANKKELSFCINSYDFDFIKSDKCYLCGFTGTTGIDRINNDLGYSIDNCASCCAACNYMKKDYKYDFFIEHLRKIISVLGAKEIIPLNHKVFICLNELKLYKSEASEVREQRKNKKCENTLNKYNEYLVKN